VSAAASGAVAVPSSDEFVVELPLGWDRLARMTTAEVFEVRGVLGHAGDFPQEVSNLGP
jgi:hypothetical protein